jgi:hypothetical protein
VGYLILDLAGNVDLSWSVSEGRRGGNPIVEAFSGGDLKETPIDGSADHEEVEDNTTDSEVSVYLFIYIYTFTWSGPSGVLD